MQFSLFGAAAADPEVADLDGLLLAGGDWVRTDGDSAARLSVLVGRPWRAEALMAEFADRGLTSDTAEAPGGLIAVRTEITPRLGQQARRWTRGAALRPPVDLALSASGLRLWAVASGEAEEGGYLLRMQDPDYQLHRVAGAQLARLGVTAVEVGGRVGTGWRVTSARRLRRLAELLGAPPAGCGRDWPAA
ncbi:MAG: hypothetical protein JO144_04475 [Actinobacteria bacterium]|nr:hypothetical protein [Actinomycetota bacterium]